MVLGIMSSGAISIRLWMPVLETPHLLIKKQTCFTVLNKNPSKGQKTVCSKCSFDNMIASKKEKMKSTATAGRELLDQTERP